MSEPPVPWSPDVELELVLSVVGELGEATFGEATSMRDLESKIESWADTTWGRKRRVQRRKTESRVLGIKGQLPCPSFLNERKKCVAARPFPSPRPDVRSPNVQPQDWLLI